MHHFRETYLKVRQAKQETLDFADDPEMLKEKFAIIECDTPNADLYKFSGTMKFPDGHQLSLTNNEVLLRVLTDITDLLLHRRWHVVFMTHVGFSAQEHEMGDRRCDLYWNGNQDHAKFYVCSLSSSFIIIFFTFESRETPSKSSSLEKEVNKVIRYMFLIFFLITVGSTVANRFVTVRLLPRNLLSSLHILYCAFYYI